MTKEPSIWESLSTVLDTAMGVKRPEDLQRYVNYLVGVLILLTIWLMTVVEHRLLLGGFLFLLVGLVSSIAWVLRESKLLRNE